MFSAVRSGSDEKAPGVETRQDSQELFLWEYNKDSEAEFVENPKLEFDCVIYTLFSGTGWGLSINYQIVVEKHGGQLLCSSQLGQGKEFTILIPVRQEIEKSAALTTAS